jgi:tetratricopeptide (TPR) repeat protein
MDQAIDFDGEAIFPGEASGVSLEVLSRQLPPEAQRQLNVAARAGTNSEVAEARLWSAYAAAPAHPAVLIALYRFYFYKDRLAEALEIARFSLEKAALYNALPGDWRQAGPGGAAFGDAGAMLPRFYLFTLKSCAYLAMRLGNFEEARAMLSKLLELDPTDKFGASSLLRVLGRMELHDDG